MKPFSAIAQSRIFPEKQYLRKLRNSERSKVLEQNLPFFNDAVFRSGFLQHRLFRSFLKENENYFFQGI